MRKESSLLKTSNIEARSDLLWIIEARSRSIQEAKKQEEAILAMAVICGLSIYFFSCS